MPDWTTIGGTDRFFRYSLSFSSRLSVGFFCARKLVGRRAVTFLWIGRNQRHRFLLYNCLTLARRWQFVPGRRQCVTNTEHGASHAKSSHRRVLGIAWLATILAGPAVAAAHGSTSVYMEDLTSPELRARIDAGTTTISRPERKPAMVAPLVWIRRS